MDVIISAWFKINSKRIVDFRLWAINILQNWYVLDKEKLKNGTFLNENYFNELLQDKLFESNFDKFMIDMKNI